MSEGSPIAALKANGSKTCSGDPATCTLSRLADDSFDYAGFADYWRASLDAYANAGITPDFLSIQNNPNWVPPASATVDACRFLPEEGTTPVTVDGTTVEVEYPGYREALAAVRTAISDLENVPKIAAPEVSGVGSVEDYARALDPADVDALSLHLYGQDAAAVDVELLQSVGDLGRSYDRPVFQTEMSANGLETAILLHHALTALDASVYIQNDFVSSASALDENPAALFALKADGFEAQPPYYVLQHYARWTDPGWLRVDALNDGTHLLSSAWLSPEEDALTIVLFNEGSTPVDAELVLPSEARQLSSTEVIRTTLDGLERSAELGELSAQHVVKVPPHAVVTVHLSAE
jgi:glucuronoarabinoxylan endo-1,4-beta-xylanase